MPEGNIILYAAWEEVVTPTDILVDALIEDYDFVCTINACEYEFATGYTYIYDLNDKLFIYEKITSQTDASGYRDFSSTIAIDTNWDVDYSYDEEENYGYEIITRLDLSGNVLTDNYSFDYFYATNRIEVEVKEDAIEEIGYFVMFINSILSSAELTMNDLE